MDDSESARERRLRRKYQKAGLRLEKTPGCHWSRYYGTGYQIVENNTVIRGHWGGRGYRNSLAEAEDMFAELVPVES